MTRFASIALILLLGCTHADAAGASQARSHKIVTLTLPRAMAANDLVRAQITTGPMARGAKLIARLPNGDIVGSVTPYAMENPARGGSHTIAIPARAIHDGKVTLHLEFLEKRGAKPRPPSERELEKVELYLIPTPR